MLELLRNDKRWHEVRTNPQYKWLLDRLFEAYDEYCKDKQIPLITFSDEMDFAKTGNRTRFEKLYFTRRTQMSVYAILSMLYPEKEEYLERLQDVICEICNEYSWQVPAHRSPVYLNRQGGLSLFSAETGLYLAEIKQMLIHRLNPYVTERITNEIDRRILTSFENETTWIENVKSNWAAVCGGSIGLTFMYESPGRFNAIKPRIDKMMDNYIDGFCDDGATSEGASYWNYGFSFYAMYMDTLRSHSFGKGKNGLKLDKVKKIANLYTNLCLDEKTMVSFSDSSSDSGYSLWLIHFLKKEYNIDMPPKMPYGIAFKEFSTALRAFMYYNPEYTAKKITPGESYYEIVEWYIKRGESYSFAVKGGHNGEEHNHNDIGSFIVASNGKQVLCDLGCPEYTASNFGAERYKILNNSSLGHSVPIVNGFPQGTGSEFCGKLVKGDKITVDLSKAYPTRIDKLIRSFELSDKKLVLTDSFSAGLNIKERFVTEIKPVISDNMLILDKTALRYDLAWKPQYHTEQTTNHDGSPRTVYMIDFVPIKQTDSFKLELTF